MACSHPRARAIPLHCGADIADLKQLYGVVGWRQAAEAARTRETAAYMADLQAAEPVSLVAAAFILYGALVVGGGKMTQAKVKKIFPRCDHKLFDVSDDMKAARQAFKNCFTALGKEHPEHFDTLVSEAARYMHLNNTVVLSVRCCGRKAACVAAGVAAALVGVAVAMRWARR